MTILLEDNRWNIDGEYYIVGNSDDGYTILDNDDAVLYENTDFESCLVWIWNS